MKRVISVSNQKGGVGKTTTAVNLAASLAAAEKRTLLIDLDPQGNASSGLGFHKGTFDKSIYDAFVGRHTLSEVTRTSKIPFLRVVPASTDLIGAEIEFVGTQDRERILKKLLPPVLGDYDVVLIDCPPSLGLLTLNSLTACDAVLIPLQCEYYALEGLSALMHTLELVQANLNPDLSVLGIVLTMFDGRNNLCKQVAQDVCQHFKEKVFDTVIPRNVRLSESPSHGLPVLLYDAQSTGAKSYLQLAREFMRRLEINEKKT